MRLGLGAVVESKHSLDDGRIFLGHADCANPSSEISLRVAVFLELDIECFLQIAHGSGQKYGSARQFRAGFVNLKAEFLSELFDLLEIGGIGAVRILELGPRQVLESRLFESTREFFTLGLGLRAKSYRDFNDLVRVRLMNQPCATNWLAFAACNNAEFVSGSHSYSFGLGGKQIGWESSRQESHK